MKHSLVCKSTVALAIVIALGAVMMAAALAQSLLWELPCYGEVEIVPGDEGKLVRCYATEPTPSPTATPTRPAPSASIVVDHNSVALFGQIPQEYLDAAASTSLLFTDRSVGVNVNEGLTCLATPFDSAPSHCKREVPPWNQVYPRANWLYRDCTSQDCTLQIQADVQADVFGWFTSYLEASQNTPPQIDQLTSYTGSGQVVLFTSSLARGEVENTRRFNESVRERALVNGLPLLDVADILSHDLDGNPCYDNRDGVEYCTAADKCENYPDDGINTPAICAQYTTEINGGHLGSMSTGKIRVAQAFWVLMAQLAGWEPGA